MKVDYGKYWKDTRIKYTRWRITRLSLCWPAVVETEPSRFGLLDEEFRIWKRREARVLCDLIEVFWYRFHWVFVVLFLWTREMMAGRQSKILFGEQIIHANFACEIGAKALTIL